MSRNFPPLQDFLSWAARFFWAACTALSTEARARLAALEFPPTFSIRLAPALLIASVFTPETASFQPPRISLGSSSLAALASFASDFSTCFKLLAVFDMLFLSDGP